MQSIDEGIQQMQKVEEGFSKMQNSPWYPGTKGCPNIGPNKLPFQRRTDGGTNDKASFQKKLDTPQKNELCQMLGTKRECQNKLFIKNKKRQIDFEAKNL